MGVFDGLIEVGLSQNPSFFNPSIVTGTVKENWNADFPGKVKVELVLGEEGKNVTGWIPVSMPYCGNGHGSYALPEVGAEVVVAFVMGNRNCPIVIGSLWNNKNKLPEETANEKNTVKRFLTKGGCELAFDEEEGKAAVRLRTPGGLALFLGDEKKQITLQDEKGENGLLIDCEKGEVTVCAKNGVHIAAGGKDMLLADGQGKKTVVSGGSVNVEADQALGLKGQNLTAEGSMVGLKAQGSFKVESSAMLELKGAMVKLN